MGMGSVSGKRSRRGGVMAEINVTPLVDVMLVLLIIFMVAAPMMSQGLEVDLPEATTRALPQSETPLVVTINKDGDLYLRKDKMAGPSLFAQLDGMAVEQKKEPIYIHADKNVPYGVVMSTLSVIHRAGFEKPSMVTLPEENRK
ncbi:MAG: protein TolR [Desulfobulbaceae bacterium]|nr:protein TolR [Desulfobulbaceae bacterium]